MEVSYTLAHTGYVQDSKGEVYKITPSHFLKMSPWKDGEDRRVVETDMGEYKMITYKNACMIVNSQFDNTTEEWDHKGKHYIASAVANKNPIEHSYLLSTLPSHNIVLKNSEGLLDVIGNHTVSIMSDDGSQELKMIKHKGKIYYILIINEYLPRVRAYNVFGEFCQWIGIDHCKPIFNATDMKYM